MSLRGLGAWVCRHPGRTVGIWAIMAISVGLMAPNLTRLAAEGQARMLGRDAESLRAAALVHQAWPDQAYESMAVCSLHRPGGLTEADLAYARRLSARLEQGDRPGAILRVLGPLSDAVIADRLVSRDRTLRLVAVPLNASFVAPSAHVAVGWLEAEAGSHDLRAPSGLEVRWTGDAVIGRDFMASVQTSLDRAAVATVVLLLLVLLAVYRSFWLALVPLVTIGISLLISRGLLAWMTLGGWEISPLVELFLVALLFGTGTDFCLFLSWRYAEHFDPKDPAGSMRLTLERSFLALLTSAGTVITGLALMGTTRFKLFSSTGPSVALGLVLTLLGSLTLTPALLVLLGRFRPRSFDGLARLGAASGTGWGDWRCAGRGFAGREHSG